MFEDGKDVNGAAYFAHSALCLSVKGLHFLMFVPDMDWASDNFEN